ncbi:diguanylate cyclase domain-containing protein [Pseudaeromonas paramecii]|uniref:diguanylate cyclase n=1 Tax=Pseudaeromonas paramecii TaxID=2138166 RepID=A0ABP8PUE0_9GAMM
MGATRFDQWLSTTWRHANEQQAICGFIATRSGARLRTRFDEFCLREHCPPIKWRMTPQDQRHPYSPLLPLLRQLIQTQGGSLQLVLSELQLFGPARSLLLDYFEGRPLNRTESPLPDDLGFQCQQIRQAIIRLVQSLSQVHPILFLVTGLHHAGESALQLISELMQEQSRSRYLLLFGLDPDFQQPSEPQQRHWDQFVGLIEDTGVLFSFDEELAPLQLHPWPSLYDVPQSPMEWLYRCERLLHSLCLPEAVRACEHTQALAELPSTEADPRFAIRFYTCWGRAAMLAGQVEDAVSRFDRILELAQRINDPAALALAYRELSLAHIYRSDLILATQCAQQAVKWSNLHGDELDQTLSLFSLFVANDKANAPFGLGRLRQLLSRLERFELMGARIYTLRNVYVQATFDARLEPDWILSCSMQAIRLARHYGYLADVASAYHGRGVIYTNLKQDHKALRCFKISERLREAIKLPSQLARIKNGIGYFHCLHERFEAAHDYLVQALTTVMRLNDYSEVSVSLYNLAWLYTLSENFDHASTLLIRLKEMVRIRGTTHFPYRNEHDIILLQGLVHALQGEWVRAEQALDRSYALKFDVSADGKFMRPLLKALIHTGQLQPEAAKQDLALVQEALDTNAGLTRQHWLLYHEARIKCHRLNNEFEQSYLHFRLAVALCREHGLKHSFNKIRRAWFKDSGQVVKLSLPLPQLQLDNLLSLVRQEQQINELWGNVREMRLLSTLQQLGHSHDDEPALGRETLRLICANFNAQAGFILLQEEASPPVELAQFNELPELPVDALALASRFGGQNQPSLSLRVRFEESLPPLRLSSVLVIPLHDGNRRLGEMLLMTFDDNLQISLQDTEALRFIGNQLTAQLVTLRQRKQLLHFSSIDSLTGLLNRQAMQQALRSQLSALDAQVASPMALAYLDLDNFKYYNDTFGHEVGDLLLRWFAALVKEELADGDLFARWGGDEFVILLPGLSRQAAQQRLGRVLHKLQDARGFEAKLQQHLGQVALPEAKWLGCSVGLTDTHQLTDALDDRALLRLADEALYQVKRQGKGHIQLSSCPS